MTGKLKVLFYPNTGKKETRSKHFLDTSFCKQTVPPKPADIGGVRGVRREGRGAEEEKLKTLKYPVSYSLVNLARNSNTVGAHS